MWLFQPISRRGQTPNADAISIKDLASAGSHLARALATISVGLLILASAGFGTVFAYTQGVHHGPMLAACAVAMALGLELAKPFAVEGVFACLRSWAFGRGLAMALLGLVAVAYSLTAELSLMATTRGDAAAERTKASDATKDDRAELARLVAERIAMSFTTATADTVMAAREAVTAAASVRAAECGKRGPNCRAREADEAAARAALAKATADKDATARASKLDTDAATVRTRLAKATPVAGTADPGAAALASYLATFGLSVPPGIVSEWLVLIGVVALELGSALSVVLVRSVGGGHKPPSTGGMQAQTAMARAEKVVDSRTPVPVLEAQRPHNAPASANSAVSRPPRKRAVERPSTPRLGNATTLTKAGAADRIVDALKEHSGRIEGASVRGLAGLIGATKSTTFNALSTLIAAGVVARLGGELVLQA